MAVIHLLRDRLLLLARNERGMALPAALFAMISSMALAGAAVVASVDVQHGTKRDSGSKSAIAAADAGANVATMRLSRYASTLSTSPCLAETGGTLVTSEPEADGWCPALTGIVGNATWSYRVSPAGGACGDKDLCVVSTGTANGVSRRIEITYNESSLSGGGSKEKGSKEEGSKEETVATYPVVEGLVGQDGIELSGNADIRVGIGTNGDIISSGNASICGDIRHGIGKKWSKSGNASQCNGYQVTEGNSTLPSVASFMPSDIATHNSNNRLIQCISTENPVECQKDSYTGKWDSTSPLNPKTRLISLSGNTTLTVGGGDYWLCQMSLSGNSQLIMADGANVRFFFDTPENCKLSAGTAQISLSGNNRISATGYQPSLGQFDVPGFYLLGSTTTPTTVNLSGNSSTINEFVLYAPNTQISITGNATYKGVIAGKKISMSGNGKVEEDSGFELPSELRPPTETPGKESSEGEETEGGTGLRYYTAQSYVECTGYAVSPPDASC